MEYRTTQEIERVAEVFRSTPQKIGLSRTDRLTRWAELLKRNPDRRLKTLQGTEFVLREDRDSMRADNSPVTVAFEDDLLRADGLRGDTYGEAKRFFELSDRQLHTIVCYCHFGAIVKAELVARRVATFATKPVGLLARIWRGLSYLRPAQQTS